jgi:Flp pilus assembly protein TadG
MPFFPISVGAEMRRSGREREEAASAVEFAILLPLLVVILGGIIDFGLMLNGQISLTHAAREGVRVEAVGTGDPVAAATDAYLAPATTGFSAAVTRVCPNGDSARLTTRATYNPFILPLGARALSSEAVMRCNG